MSAICIFDAGAGGPGNPAPGGASPRQKFLGPAPGGASPRQKFSGPAPAGAFAPAEFSGPAPAGAAAPPGQAPPGAGFTGARPRAPADLANYPIVLHNTLILVVFGAFIYKSIDAWYICYSISSMSRMSEFY